MNESDYNENDMQERENAEEKERLKQKTIARMFEGARREQARFDELQKLKKDLKSHLKVLLLITISTIQYLFSISSIWNSRKTDERKLKKNYPRWRSMGTPGPKNI